MQTKKDISLISSIVSEQIEKRKLLFLTINYYWMDTEAFLNSKHYITLLRSHSELPEKNYFLKYEYKTFLIDLAKTKEDIYSSFDYTGAKYKIRKALKSGIQVKLAKTAAENQQFYDFYQAFVASPSKKNKILVLNENEIQKLTIFYAVSAEGEYLGGIGLLSSLDGRYLLYKYAATLHKCCENELLLWYAMQYAKDARYSWFDMSCFLPTKDKGSDQYRLFQFKKKFGGKMVSFYTYVNLRGPFKIPGSVFKIILKCLFKDDINKFALCLKKLKIFK